MDAHIAMSDADLKEDKEKNDGNVWLPKMLTMTVCRAGYSFLHQLSFHENAASMGKLKKNDKNMLFMCH